MFKQPQNSNAFVRIAKWAIAAVLALQLANAAHMTQIDLRCGAACQRIVNHGREF